MDRIGLLQFLRDKFNNHDLPDMRFILGNDYETLSGDNKAAKARELILLCERRWQLMELEQPAQRLLNTSARGGHRTRPIQGGKQINVADNYLYQPTYGDTYTINVDRMENLVSGRGAQVNKAKAKSGRQSFYERFAGVS